MNNLTDWQGINSHIYATEVNASWNQLPTGTSRAQNSQSSSVAFPVLVYKLADAKILELYLYTFQLFVGSGATVYSAQSLAISGPAESPSGFR